MIRRRIRATDQDQGSSLAKFLFTVVTASCAGAFVAAVGAPLWLGLVVVVATPLTANWRWKHRRGVTAVIVLFAGAGVAVVVGRGVHWLSWVVDAISGLVAAFVLMRGSGSVKGQELRGVEGDVKD